MSSFPGANQKSGTPVKYICCVAGFLLIGIIVALSVAAIGGFGGLLQLTPGGGFGGVGEAGSGDLTCPANLNPETAGNCLDEYMKSAVPGAPLIGHGKNFVTSGQQYNTNPALMVALAQQETSLYANPSKNSRFSGSYNYFNKDGASFSSFEAAINEHGRFLGQEYIAAGQTTITQIGNGKNGQGPPNWVVDTVNDHAYCPYDGKTYRDPVNANWIPGVTKNFNAIVAKCPEFAAASSSSGGVLNGQCTFPVADKNWRAESYWPDDIGYDIGVNKSGLWEPKANGQPPDESSTVKTPVLAIANGTISPNGNGFGPSAKNPWWLNRLWLVPDSGQYDSRYSFYYNHITEFASGIAPEATVKKNQILGWVYRPARTYHLHFGVAVSSANSGEDVQNDDGITWLNPKGVIDQLNNNCKQNNWDILNN